MASTVDDSHPNLHELFGPAELRALPARLKFKIDEYIHGKNLAIATARDQLNTFKADSERRNLALEREISGYKIKLQMSEDFAIKLREQLKTVEDTLQKSRLEFYEAIIGILFK